MRHNVFQSLLCVVCVCVGGCGGVGVGVYLILHLCRLASLVMADSSLCDG